MNHLAKACNTATSAAIYAHLLECDAKFTPPLSARVSLSDYAAKLAARADRFEAWTNKRLVGLVAAYLSAGSTAQGWISNVSVTSDFAGKGLASELFQECRELASTRGIPTLGLEVAATDFIVQRLYNKWGFKTTERMSNGFLRMQLTL